MEVGQLLELPAWYLRLAAMSKAPTAKTALTLFCHAAHIFPAQLFFFLTMSTISCCLRARSRSAARDAQNCEEMVALAAGWGAGS
jgi:hypothetical protein